MEREFQHRACPACGGPFAICSVLAGCRRMARCEVCGHIFVQNPLPWRERLFGFQGMDYFDANYRHQGITSPEDDAQWTAWVADRVAGLAPILGPGPGKILEAGCLEGRMLSGLAALGHAVCGCDPNREIVERGRRHLGLDLRAGTAEECFPHERGEFDAALAYHVLNFTACPRESLAEWARLLRPGGLLVVVVPLRQVEMGYFLCQQYFTRRSLAALAETLLAEFTLETPSGGELPAEGECTARLVGRRGK